MKNLGRGIHLVSCSLAQPYANAAVAPTRSMLRVRAEPVDFEIKANSSC